MGIPDFQTLMRPVLVAIQGDEPKTTGQIRDTVATALNVSDEDRQVLLPSGKQALYTNRVAWAITHMSQAGLLDRPERGRYALSERGTKVLQEHPDRVDLHVLQQFSEYRGMITARTAKSKDVPVEVVVYADGEHMMYQLDPQSAIKLADAAQKDRPVCWGTQC